jgi:OPT oligopeptide transporter protein
LLAQIVPGTLLPGNPVANMVTIAFFYSSFGDADLVVVVQSLLCADAHRVYIVCTRSKVGSLCEGSPAIYFYWYVILFLFLDRIHAHLCVIVQAVATVLAAFVQAGMKQWLFTRVPDICQPNQKSDLTCPHNQVFFTASAIWYALLSLNSALHMN